MLSSRDRAVYVARLLPSVADLVIATDHLAPELTAIGYGGGQKAASSRRRGVTVSKTVGPVP